MAIAAMLTEEEAYLVALIQDDSGIDLAEMLWEDIRIPELYINQRITCYVSMKEEL